MKTPILFILSVLFLVSSFSNASSYLGKAPESGLIISVSPAKIPLVSGESVLIKGTIKYVKKSQSGKANNGNDKKQGLLEEFIAQGVEITGAFPSAVVDISSRLNLRSISDSEIEFSYLTNNLVADDPNQFSIKVYNNHTHKNALKRLSLVQAKLDKRVQLLAKLRQNHPLIEKEIVKLNAIIAKISNKLNANENLMADNTYALQVDNSTANDSKISTVMNNFRFVIDVIPGSAIQGEKVNFKSQIVSLLQANENSDTTEDADGYLAEFYFNNQSLSSQRILKDRKNVDVSFDYITSPLNLASSNIFTIALYHLDDAGQRGQRIGYLNQKIPVIVDSVKPIWISQSSEQLKYVKVLNPINIKAQDLIGRINASSFSASLDSTISGSSALKIISNKFIATELNNGSQYVWIGDINPLDDGSYTFVAKVSDFALNESLSYIENFILDRKSPVIELTSTGSGITNNSNYTVSIKVEDLSPTTTEVFVNEVLVAVHAEKEISLLVNLTREGANTIRINSSDAAGNISNSTSLNIYYDKTPPVVKSFLASGVTTNVSSTLVSISDVSDVITEVYSENNVLIRSTTEKQFSLNFNNQGPNTFIIKSKDSYGNTADDLILNFVYDTVAPLLSTNLKEKYLTQSLPKEVIVSFTSNEDLESVEVNGHPLSLTNLRILTFNSIYDTDGDKVIDLKVRDRAGNERIESYKFLVELDSTPPSATIGQTPSLTNKNDLLISFQVHELNNVTSTIKVNNEILAILNEKNFTYLVTLPIEGNNTVEIISKDFAGNVSNSVVRNIFKDTIAPTLTDLIPEASSSIDRVNFAIGGKSSEPLENISVNGSYLALSSDKKLFSSNYVSENQGIVNLVWTATDLAGNQASLMTSVMIAPRLLISELVAIIPENDTRNVRVIGAIGSSRPNAEIEITTGFFSSNRGSAIVKADGSFNIRMEKFTDADLKATDLSTGETSNIALTDVQNNILSGVIKNTDNNPLKGVTVQLQDSTVAVQTDESGVFSFNTTVTGDQVLLVDGSTAEVPGELQIKYSKTKIAVNIGTTQANVIDRPIYLTPLYLDGTQTTIVPNTSVVVESSRAPGVKLEIPANTTQFPTGTQTPAINITTINAVNTTIPVPENFVPTKVLALEPSGTKFSQPVKLTVPNDSELPPKTPMIFLSMNSSTGKWELDGYGKVTDDGSSVVTNEDSGITHFSLSYAVPLAPFIASFKNPNIRGIEINKGGLETEIQAPRFSVIGKSVRPTLKYNSGWANPTAVISKSFSVADTTTITSGIGAGTTSPKAYQILYKRCYEVVDWSVILYTKYKTRCEQYWVDRVYEMSYTFNWQATNFWVPDQINSQFFVDKFASNQVSIQNSSITSQVQSIGPEVSNAIATEILKQSGVPNSAIISYAIELKDPDTNAYLDSGIHASRIRYQIRLKNLTISTVNVTQTINDRDASNSGTPKQNVLAPSTTVDSSALNFLPEDSNQNILIQNHVDSPAGRGWKIAGASKIYNPTNSTIMVEDSNGGVATYSIDNTISTVFDGSTNSNLDFAATVSLEHYPSAYIASKNSSNESFLTEIGLAQANPIPTNIHTLPILSGKLSSQGFHTCSTSLYCDDGGCYTKYSGSFKSSLYAFKALFSLGGLVKSASDEFFLLDKKQHALYRQNGQAKLMGGSSNIDDLFAVNQFYEGTSGFFKRYLSDTSSNINTKCQNSFGNACAAAVEQSTTFNCNTANLIRACTTSTGQLQVIRCTTSQAPQFMYTPSIGTLGKSGSDLSSLNSPSQVIARNNKLYIADTGNNRVISYDITTQAKQIVAGNGQNVDSGNGGLATQAGIFHPTSLVFDSSGNLYISSENGFIRRVDSTGTITLLAGKSLQNGGVISDEAPLLNMAMSNPTYMLYDSDSNMIYVSDTNNHRVLQLDINNGVANKIAGTGACSTEVSDGGAALNASLCQPTSLGFDDQKNLLITDSGHKRIRRLVFSAYQSGAVAFQSTGIDGSRMFKNSNDTWTRQFRNGNYESYNSRGLQVRMTERTGRMTQFEYDADDNLMKIIYPFNSEVQKQELEFEYSNGKLAAIVDPSGRRTEFTIINGILEKVEYPDSTNRQFVYDSKGRIIEDINANNKKTQYTYNEYSKLIKITNPNGTSKRIFDFSSQSIAVNSTDSSLPPMTTIGFGENQASTKLYDELNRLTEIVHDQYGFNAILKDSLGRITKTARNQYGQPVLITKPDNSEIEFVYNNNPSDLIKVIDRSTGHTVESTYDVYGNRLTFKNAKGRITTFQYHATSGLLEEIATQDGIQRLFEYTSLGQIKKETVTKNGTSRFKNYAYNNLGHLFSVTDELGKVTTYEYDLAGNISKAVTSDNGINQIITNYTYDIMNRLKTVLSPKGELTTYTYGFLGELLSVYNQNGLIYSQVYDDLNRVVQKSDSGGNTYQFFYDEVGNKIKEIDPNGVNKIFTYDSIYRLTNINLPDDSIEIQYDLLSYMSQAKNSNSKIDFIYDSLGRLINEKTVGLGNIASYPANQLEYTYDSLGNRLTLTSSFKQSVYTYDSDSNLTNLSTNTGDSYVFTQDNLNRISSIIRPNASSLRTSYGYDTNGTLNGIEHFLSSTKVDFINLGYDSRNIINSKIDHTGSYSIVLNENGQITNAVNSNNSTFNETFSFDINGNRISDNLVSLYSYDNAATRLNEDSNYTYSYDLNGNIIAKVSKSAQNQSHYLTYNSKNQLINVDVKTFSSNNLLRRVEFQYDVLGRRIYKKAMDNADPVAVEKNYVRYFLYDGKDLIGEFSGSNEILASFTHSPFSTDNLLSAYIYQAGKNGKLSKDVGLYYMLNNHLGSTTSIANSTGTIVQRYGYSLYGKQRKISDQNGNDISNDPQINSRFTYAGREFDSEIGLYYNRARYYDPITGRFLQKDPYSGNLSQPLSVTNAYAYSNNNPILFRDPSGKYGTIIYDGGGGSGWSPSYGGPMDQGSGGGSPWSGGSSAGGGTIGSTFTGPTQIQIDELSRAVAYVAQYVPAIAKADVKFGNVPDGYGVTNLNYFNPHEIVINADKYQNLSSADAVLDLLDTVYHEALHVDEGFSGFHLNNISKWFNNDMRHRNFDHLANDFVKQHRDVYLSRSQKGLQ